MAIRGIERPPPFLLIASVAGAVALLAISPAGLPALSGGGGISGGAEMSMKDLLNDYDPGTGQFASFSAGDTVVLRDRIAQSYARTIAVGRFYNITNTYLVVESMPDSPFIVESGDAVNRYPAGSTLVTTYTIVSEDSGGRIEEYPKLVSREVQ